MSHLFCFGLGYCATVAARRLQRQGWRISGSSRSADGARNLASAGFGSFVFDGTSRDPALAAVLADVTHILLSIPPDAATGDPALKTYRADLATSEKLRWIGYFSTIGVYGDSGGAWVSEETEACPGSERGQRRRDAEVQWLALGKAVSADVAILRLPGIYGPGRSAIEDLRAGTARRLVKPGQVFNRAHVEDIASTVEAAIRHPVPHGVFNVTDDEPAPPQDVVEFAANLIGVPVPPAIDFATAALSPMARSFYSESKRVSNSRIKRELGVSLAFPTYRDGLRAIAALQNSKNTA